MSTMSIADLVHMATLPPQAARAYMRECNMTLEERERHLYVTGRTGEAAALQQAIDLESEALDSMTQERDEFKESADRYERENGELQEAVETAEEKVLTLTTDLENAQDEVQQLREQIRAAGVDLV